MRKILTVETRLLLREPAGLIFAVLLPIGLLLILGSLPTFRTPDPKLGGMRLIDNHFPAMMTALAVVTLAFVFVPSALALYREKGILRRMSTTPVHPVKLLAAQLVLNGVTAVVAVVLMIVAGGLVHGVPAPRNVAGFALSFVLGVASLFAIGLTIAAVVGAKAAPAIGNVLMFPLLFFSGVWMPREMMPEALRRIGDFLPVAPFGQAMRDTWAGGSPQVLNLVAMAMTLLGAGVVAVRTFRWE
ncbi:ABC transporter permease [Spongiactinospora rosea]|uniref:Transport permease protein n=1 Tax=Spongiactinospora rosea TaxID=2248750 RepID=A0A366LP32_9ACTN|nr:ABC transporter permease [Spongiactinospora rosea]RBQ15715.1 ABC transporter permease [Spongiactinospora rosea]